MASRALNYSDSADRVSSVGADCNFWPSLKFGDVEMHQVMNNTQRICYVSRNDSNKRVVIDEYQIIQMLNRDFKDIANITTIIPSNHNLLQQMFFFQTCTIVVGPHGAGLTNVLFTKSQYFKGMIIFPMINLNNITFHHGFNTFIIYTNVLNE